MANNNTYNSYAVNTGQVMYNPSTNEIMYTTQPFDYASEALPEGLVFGGLDTTGQPLYYDTTLPSYLQLPMSRQQMLICVEERRNKAMLDAMYGNKQNDHQEELRRKYSTLSDYKPATVVYEQPVVIQQEVIEEPVSKPEVEKVDAEALNAYNKSMLRGEPTQVNKDIEKHVEKLNKDSSKLTSDTMGNIGQQVHDEYKEVLEEREVRLKYPRVDGTKGAVYNVPGINRQNCGLTQPNWASSKPNYLPGFDYKLESGKGYTMDIYHTTNMKKVYGIDNSNLIVKSKFREDLANDIMFTYPDDLRPILALRKNSSNAAEGVYIIEKYKFYKDEDQTEEEWLAEIEYAKQAAKNKPGLQKALYGILGNMKPDTIAPDKSIFYISLVTFIHSSEFAQHDTIYCPGIQMLLSTKLDGTDLNPLSEKYREHYAKDMNKDVTVVTMEVVNNNGNDVKNYYVNVGNKNNPIEIKSNTSIVKEEGLYVNIVSNAGLREDFIPKEEFKQYDIYDNPEDVCTRDYNKDLLKKLEYETRQRELEQKQREIEANKDRAEIDRLKADLELKAKEKTLAYEDRKRETERLKAEYDIKVKQLNVQHEETKKELEKYKHELEMKKEERKLEIEQEKAKIQQEQSQRAHEYAMQKQYNDMMHGLEMHRRDMAKLDRQARYDDRKFNMDTLRHALQIEHEQHKFGLEHKRFIRDMHRDELKFGREVQRSRMEHRHSIREQKMKTLTGLLSSAIKGGLPLGLKRSA